MKKYLLLLIVLFFSSNVFCVSNNLVLSLEGNAGAGKSTLLNILQKELGITPIAEPFDKWNDINGKGNLFEQFSNDPVRWAFTQNLYASFTKMQLFSELNLQAHNNKTVVLDRSRYADIYVYGRVNTEKQFWQPLEKEIHAIISGLIEESVGYKVDGFIYLQTPPEICQKRVEKRNNLVKHPVNFTREFYNYFHSLHEDWLVKKVNVDSSIASIPILVVNGGVDFEHQEQAKEKIAQSIRNFIAQIKDNGRNE